MIRNILTHLIYSLLLPPYLTSHISEYIFSSHFYITPFAHSPACLTLPFNNRLSPHTIFG